MPLLGVRRVVVELGLVLGPDRLLGRLAGIGLGALDNDPHALGILVEKVLHVRGYDALVGGRPLAVVGGLGHLALSLLTNVVDGDHAVGAGPLDGGEVYAQLPRLAPGRVGRLHLTGWGPVGP